MTACFERSRDGWQESREGSQGCRNELFRVHVSNLEGRVEEGKKTGFHEYRKTIKLDGKWCHISELTKDKYGNLWSDGLSGSTLSWTSSNRSSILILLPKASTREARDTLLKLQPSMLELTDFGKSVRPDGFLVELFKFALWSRPVIKTSRYVLRPRLLDNAKALRQFQTSLQTLRTSCIVLNVECAVFTDVTLYLAFSNFYSKYIIDVYTNKWHISQMWQNKHIPCTPSIPILA